ncbi:MAG: SDR family NAD(P)-dependent oxidoreductase, partial [Desulfobacterales bacterium]|nr:SDR family NAD(P)-dependent oxidoreductase [Desulfobacterales bacterium]
KAAGATCAIGSVKSNIGHLESAAGVAGVTKVLLQMKNKTLAPSLHAARLNPDIPFEDTPFTVQRELAPWKPPEISIDGRTETAPRRAGVSSFGAGGANAHVILEEYRRPCSTTPEPESRAPGIFLLSARDPEGLRALARRVLDFLKKTDAPMARVLYTLQVGRSALAERLALPGADKERIVDDLSQWLDDESGGVYRGRVADAPGRTGYELLLEGRAGAEFIRALLRDGEVHKLARLWVSGVDIDWNLLYLDKNGRRETPGRISLPTYPFAGPRHWIGRLNDHPVHPSAPRPARGLHPLIDENVSSLETLKFVTRLNGGNSFLNDHVVADHVVFPGAAGIEIACAAGEMAMERKVRKLTNLTWTTPIRLSGSPGKEAAGEIVSSFSPSGDHVRFELATSAGARRRTVHLRGEIFDERGSGARRSPDHQRSGGASFEIESFRERSREVWSGEDCYRVFPEYGLHYGPAFRCIDAFYPGEEFALSRLQAPRALQKEFPDFLYHPVLIDGALQTAFLMMTGAAARVNETYMPYSMEEIEVYRALPDACFALALRAGNGAPDRYDISILDEQGDEMLKIKGLSVRSVKTGRPRRPAGASDGSRGRAARAPGAVHASDGEVRGALEARLIELFAGELKMPASEIDAETSFMEFGLDSILAADLTRAMEQVFGDLSKTILFEHFNIGELAAFFLEKHRETVLDKIVGESRGDRVKESPETGVEKRPRRFNFRILSETGRGAKNKSGDVAIIGLGGRYPMAGSLDEFWENLASGRDCITTIPAERWDYRDYFSPDPDAPGKSYSKWGGFIDDVDRFDPLFFNIPPREARLMDPQERLFLEITWKTMEDAGYTRATLGAEVGVFVGVMYGHYQLYGGESGKRGAGRAPASFFSSAANRVSYFFDFHGPSMAVDTLCSSSLTAIHLACDSIRKGEIEAAVAGGVNLTIHPRKYILLAQGKLASSDGRCRSFGNGGDGYVPGEGVGAVLLKGLENARAHGDHIYGVIKAGALNHGGQTGGYAVPNPNNQSRVIRDALERAGISPGRVGCVEAQGVGSALGDPLEINALKAAFRGGGDRTPRCSIGSVKSNIGHLEAAAGVAGLTKVLLQMRRGQLAPSLHSETLNPEIRLEDSPFYIQRTLSKWERNGAPRVAGVSSFGAGGSNAHLIIEEYESPVSPADPVASPRLFPFSAKTMESLKARAREMIAFLEKHPDLPPRDVAYTLQVGREPMKIRLGVIASDAGELVRSLSRWVDVFADQASGEERRRDGAVYFGNGGFPKKKLPAAPPAEALDRLADFWVKGGDVPWQSFYPEPGGAGSPRRTPLPTYAFTGKKYWLPGPDERSRPRRAPEKRPGAPGEGGATLYFRHRWERVDEEPGHGIDPGAERGVHLVFDNRPGISGALERRLQGRGAVVRVASGDGFQRIDDRLYTIDPGRRDDYGELIRALHERGLIPEKILYAWGGDPAAPPGPDPALQKGFYSVLYLTRALMERGFRPSDGGPDALRLLYAYTDHGENGALFAALSSLFKMIYYENPRFYFKAAEMDPVSEDALDDMLRELHAGPKSRESMVNIRRRGARRWERRLAVLEPDMENRDEAPIKENGVYLITGGAGALGLIFAARLAGGSNGKALLVGRSAPTPEMEANIRAVQPPGAQIHYFQADISDPGEVDRLVSTIKTRFGGIDGVVHAAGVLRNSFLARKKSAEAAEVFAAKIFGTMNLDESTKEEALDFFVLFSSITTEMEMIGQSDYAFANAFMDHFAEKREALRRGGRRRGKSLSINWPFWEKGGMRMREKEIRHMIERTGLRPMPTMEGVRAFEKALGWSASQCFVAFGDPGPVRRFFTPREVREGLPPGAPGDPDRLLERVEKTLVEILSEVIEIEADEIDPRDDFREFGLDSILLETFNTRIEERLAPLPVYLMFEERSLHDFAAHLVEHHGPRLPRELPSRPAGSRGVAPPFEREPDREAPAVAPGGSTPHSSLSARGDGRVGDIAVIGMAGRFPGAENIREFWENLKNGVDAVTEVPGERWNADARHSSHIEPGRSISKWGGFIESADAFDPLFFRISPGDARVMDPRQRLFLEECWKALEDAGRLPPGSRGENCGVYVGVSENEYLDLQKPTGDPGRSVQMMLGNQNALLASRIAYFLDLKGPAISLDTACSSSLVAVHLACQGLQNREIDLALAGGVALSLSEESFIVMSQAGILSPTGRCRPFDHRADGIAAGEAVGVVALKRLEDALGDRDHIYGVIKGSGVNQDGKTDGITAPSMAAQRDLARAVYDKNGVDPRTITCMEAHGTGTKLGDPIEVSALSAAFGHYTDRKEYCAIGSVKSNVGHTMAAAGVTSLIKVLLSLTHGMIPPALHYEKSNRHIRFRESPFYVNTAPAAWEGEGRRAAVSSFGFSGTNCHMVVEEAPVRAPVRAPASDFVFTLSAQNEERLKAYVEKMLRFLTREPRFEDRAFLADLTCTLQTGRAAMAHRLAMVVRDARELMEKLSGRLETGRRDPDPGVYAGRRRDSGDGADAGENAGENARENAGEKVKTAIRENNLHDLARLWANGADVQWETLYAAAPPAERPGRISLPTHPFARERFWFADVHPDDGEKQPPRRPPKTKPGAAAREGASGRGEPNGRTLVFEYAATNPPGGDIAVIGAGATSAGAGAPSPPGSRGPVFDGFPETADDPDDPVRAPFFETLWKTIESAGCTREVLADPSMKTNVFIRADENARPGVLHTLSSVFHLAGPGKTIHLAESFTTIDSACESIGSGESETAVAGGVDASFSSACLLLKSLTNAMADHDYIYGMIQDRKTNPGKSLNGLSEEKKAVMEIFTFLQRG